MSSNGNQLSVVGLEGDPRSDAAGLSPSQSSPRKLSVLMPVYNERWTVGEIVRRVLAAPVPLELELVVVDDASRDGSWDVIQRLSEEDSRIRAFRHPQNRGKGAAVRTAIREMTGDVAVIQDADLEYDPAEYGLLLKPILDGRADAVFGSRFVGHTRRVLFFWHTLINRSLTLVSNMLNDLNLTDMETCYKMVRAPILKRLRLSSNTFTIEPELTCRLAQWGARIYEVPISYFGRTYEEGKKIGALDGLRAVWAMLRARFIDTRFTDHAGFLTLSSVARSTRYNQWILDQVKDYLGHRVLEAGAGIGNLSGLLLNRERLVLVDNEAMYVSALRRRFAGRTNVRVERADLTCPNHYDRWLEERLDTVFCSNVLEHLEGDLDVLRSFHRSLVPGGHCVIVVPAGRWLYTPVDRELGHRRRYTQQELRARLIAAGFDVVDTRQFSKLGTLSWAVSGHLLRRRTLSARQMAWFDRIMPAVRILEHVLPVPGMSLIMVGRKPERAATRIAA